MKKIFIFILVLIANQFAFAYSVEATNGLTVTRENTTNWQFKRPNSNRYTLQNITGKTIRFIVNVDAVIQGTTTPSDPVYLFCGSTFTLIQPNMDVICDVSYPGNAQLVSVPFVNGASGHYSISL